MLLEIVGFIRIPLIVRIYFYRRFTIKCMSNFCYFVVNLNV